MLWSFVNPARTAALLTKSYGQSPIHEAIVDHRTIVADIDDVKSSLLGSAAAAARSRPTAAGNFRELRDALSASVRKFVSDSTAFVSACTETAAANTSDGAQLNARLFPATTSAVRSLAAVAVDIRRLTSAAADVGGAIAQLVDFVVDVASVFGEMLDAGRLIVDSRSETGRRFAVDTLNGHAVGLARVLVGLVQRIRTM